MRGISGVTDLATHEVSTGDLLKTEIEDLVQAGIVRPSVSPWSSPIVPVAKPGDAVGLCLDYRKLNSVTIPDSYYIPLIDDILDQVREAMYLSKLDLSKGFYQVPLDEVAIPKSAFITPLGKFEFLRMPFGMRNAPLTFQRLMDKVLADACLYARSYIYDILIFSKTWENHLVHNEEVLKRLAQADLTTKP